jgi:cytochrome b subunit of formate dehydrogenase
MMLRFCCTLVVGLLVLCGGRASAGLANKDCLECHNDKDLTKTNAAGKSISLFVDAAKLSASVHKTNSCASCHQDVTEKHPDDNVAIKPVACSQCHHRQSDAYGASIHAQAKRAGQSESAGCTDCHGSHAIYPKGVIGSPLHYTRLAKTCGECHPDASADVEQSVHGRALARGNRESATCTDCHSEHAIEKLKGGSKLKVAGEVCGKCHASERMNTRFSIPQNRVKTFMESYHGLALQSGDTHAANCGSCHGVHKILRSTDPLSSIHSTNLVTTCGKCHAEATVKFAQGRIHLDLEKDNDIGSVVNRWVRKIYLVLIFSVVGGLFLHNFIAWIRKVVAMYHASDRTVVRMDAGQRGQHLVLLVSFIVLAISGFALKYPDSWLVWLFGSDENVRRWVHRVAGIVLMGVGFWHLGYLLVSAAGRQLLKDLWFRPQDVLDIFSNVFRLLTGKGTGPRFGRFGYPEKLEYWAVVWGTIIMGATGLVIWFKVGATTWLPRWAIDVAVTIHYYEAILACLAIIVWHFYHVIFDPGVYPMSWAWLDGKVSKHWHEEEHPLDTQAPGATPAPTKSVKTDKPGH